MTIAGDQLQNVKFVSIAKNLVSNGVCFWREISYKAGSATGIMGLAYNQLANTDSNYHPTTMSQITADGIPNAFALRLCPAKSNTQGVGTIAFGTPSALRKVGSYTYPDSAFQKIKVQDRSLSPYDPGSWYYDVKMTNACTKGSTCNTFPDDWSDWQFTIFDSGWGSAGALLPNVYSQVKSQLQSAGVDSCFFSTTRCCTKDITAYPDLEFSFESPSGGTTNVHVVPSVYLACACGDCSNGRAFAFSSSSSNSVMGNVVQSQYYEIFDRTSSPAQLMLAAPATEDQTCPCVNGLYTSSGCQCYAGCSGSRCETCTAATSSSSGGGYSGSSGYSGSNGYSMSLQVQTSGRWYERLPAKKATAKPQTSGTTTSTTTTTTKDNTTAWTVAVVCVAAVAVVAVAVAAVFYHKLRTLQTERHAANSELRTLSPTSPTAGDSGSDSDGKDAQAVTTV
jgi:hypothetical protein